MTKKIIILLFLSSLINSMIVCQENVINRIINISNNKEFEKLLKYKIQSDSSPSGRFIFINAICTLHSDNEVGIQKLIKEEKIKNDIVIDGFKFKKGEYRWWFIYDVEKKKIIYKDSDLFLHIVYKHWDEKNNYFIFNFFSTLVFYNLKDPAKKSFELYLSDDYNYQFSENNKMLAYQTSIKSFHYDVQIVPAEIGIKIRDIYSDHDIILIKPKYEYSTLEIIKWDLNNKIIYREINKIKNISEIREFDLNENINNEKYMVKKYTPKKGEITLKEMPLNNKNVNTKNKIKKNEKVEILTELIEKRTKIDKDDCQNCNWVLVISENGNIGWCLFDDLEQYNKKEDIKLKFLTPNISNLSFRESPSRDGKFLRLLTKGEKLELLEKGKEETIEGVKGNLVKIKTEKGEK